MTNGTEKYIKTINYLSKLYDFANDKFFDNKLTKPVITVQTDERNRSYGWWTCGKVWKETTSAEGEYEMNISAQFLDRDIHDIFATLLHEMCHQYADLHKIQDTSRSGSYHNKLFKKIGDEHGLVISFNKRIGWSVMELKDTTVILLDEWLKDNSDSVIYRDPWSKGIRVKSSSIRKYICPVCGQSVRATKKIHLLCAECMELLIEK